MCYSTKTSTFLPTKHTHNASLLLHKFLNITFSSNSSIKDTEMLGKEIQHAQIIQKHHIGTPEKDMTKAPIRLSALVTL